MEYSDYTASVFGVIILSHDVMFNGENDMKLVYYRIFIHLSYVINDSKYQVLVALDDSFTSTDRWFLKIPIFVANRYTETIDKSYVVMLCYVMIYMDVKIPLHQLIALSLL